MLFLTIYPQERKILSQFEQGCLRWNLWCLTGGNEDFQPADEKVRTVSENQICRQWPKSGLQSVGRLKVQPFPRFLHGQFIHTSTCKYSWVCLNLNLVSCWASETPAPGPGEHDPEQPMSTTSSGSRQLFLGQKESLLLLWEWLPQQNQFIPGGDGSCLKLRWWWVHGCGIHICLVSEVCLLSLRLWGERVWSAVLLSPSGHYSLPAKLEMWAGRGGEGCCSRPLRPLPSGPMHVCQLSTGHPGCSCGPAPQHFKILHVFIPAAARLRRASQARANLPASAFPLVLFFFVFYREVVVQTTSSESWHCRRLHCTGRPLPLGAPTHGAAAWGEPQAHADRDMSGDPRPAPSPSGLVEKDLKKSLYSPSALPSLFKRYIYIKPVIMRG